MIKLQTLNCVPFYPQCKMLNISRGRAAHCNLDSYTRIMENRLTPLGVVRWGFNDDAGNLLVEPFLVVPFLVVLGVVPFLVVEPLLVVLAVEPFFGLVFVVLMEDLVATLVERLVDFDVERFVVSLVLAFLVEVPAPSAASSIPSGDRKLFILVRSRH